MVNDGGLLIARGLVHKNEQYKLNLEGPGINNAHLIVVGESGSGKTTLLVKIINEMFYQGKTVFLIDFHGDMGISGENYIKYTPRNSPYGVNPFELEINAETGGVKIQSEIITSMLNQYFMDNGLGKKQRNILRELIVDTYKSKGIYEDDMNTWTKEVPIMEDLGKLADYIRKVLNAEVNTNVGILKESIKNIKSYMPKESFEKTKESIEKIEEVVNDINIENEKQLYGNINLGYYLHSSVKRVFEGLYVYLEDIVKMTIFNSEKPRITKGVNRLDFSAFTQVNKPLIAKFLAEFTAQKLFRASMIRGQYSELEGVTDGSKFDRILVFDESKLALPNGAEKNNSYNIFNRICLESRKYGLALFLASQRVEHYSEEILSNVFTKIILKVKANDYKSVARALGLKEDFVADTFSITKERPAIIDTNGSKHSYIIERFKD